MIQIDHVYYRYTTTGPRWALEDINLQVEPGEYVLLSGASGSGKSSLCRTFNGLIPHFYGGMLEGRVWAAGLDVGAHPVSELFAHVGLIFQNPEAQLFNGTVERELAFGLESLGLPRREIWQRVAESADLMGISALLPRNPHNLSGGEQNLVAIAAALALRPQVIALDEPYAHLDPANVNRVRNAVRKINRLGTAVVVTEHRLQNVVEDVDHIVVLQQGRIVLEGAPRKVLAQDVTAFGLNPPPVVRAARELGLSQVPLSTDELMQAIDGALPPAEVFANRPAVAATTGDAILRAEQVSFILDRTPILRNVDLGLHAGECLAIVGANGAGKTTLIKHFNGLYRPTQGRVTVMRLDTRYTRVSELARYVGLAFQNPNDQFFRFQVRDEIVAGAQALGRYDGAWLDELVDMFHLGPLMQRSPYRLSEGEKRRVAFASALAAQPSILVLDEPTAGQDFNFRETLGQLLDRLRTRRQTVVLVTHDLEFAEQQADRWVLMADGEVLSSGQPWEVMADGAAMRQAGLEPTQTFQLQQAFRKLRPQTSPEVEPGG
jgi:energy-coupling factor transporter ATP-binding protein EcfA2